MLEPTGQKYQWIVVLLRLHDELDSYVYQVPRELAVGRRGASAY